MALALMFISGPALAREKEAEAALNRVSVKIDGYTDSVGGVAYNQQLSLDRANAVKSILMDAGVAGD
jgi:outer membrane protein OmpA-like peptidoglycan-associated protein